MVTRFVDVNLNDIHQILTEIRSLLKPGVAEERLAALSKYQSFNISGSEFDEFTKLYLQMHDSKVDFIQRVKPIIKKIRGYVVNEKAEDMKRLYHEIRVNPIFCWHLRSILFESLIKMANAIFKFVEDPENLEDMDEIVNLHRDLRISREKRSMNSKAYFCECQATRTNLSLILKWSSQNSRSDSSPMRTES